MQRVGTGCVQFAIEDDVVTDAAAVCAHTADAHTVATLLKLWFRNGTHPGPTNAHVARARMGATCTRHRCRRGPKGRLRVPERRTAVSSACPVRVRCVSITHLLRVGHGCHGPHCQCDDPPQRPRGATLRTARHVTHPLSVRAPRLTCLAPPLGPELPMPIVPANLYKAAVQAAEQARAAARNAIRAHARNASRAHARNASRAHARCCAGRCGRLARGACTAAAAQLPRGRVPHTLPCDGPRPPSARS